MILPKRPAHLLRSLPARSALTWGAAALALCALVTPAQAAIDNFTVSSIKGVGALSGNLSQRLGTTQNDDEHFINAADCAKYAGQQIEITVRIDPLPVTGDYTYAAAYAGPGSTCETEDTNPPAADGCTVLRSDAELDVKEYKFNVDMDKLMGECNTTTDSLARFYFIIQEPSQTVVAFETIEFDVDFRVPATPVLDSVTAGDGRFFADWTDTADEDETEYNVYYSATDFSDSGESGVKRLTGVTATSVSVDDDSLVNGTEYFVRVSALDEADNESPLSNSVSVVPLETTDFWEAYVASGGPDEGGFCFVATAAWGSPMADDLATLRAFRDEILMTSASGRAFVAEYYRWGRFAAAWIADKPALRAVARVLLTPLVWFAQLALWLSPLGALAALGAAFMLLARARRELLAHILRDVPAEARR